MHQTNTFRIGRSHCYNQKGLRFRLSMDRPINVGLGITAIDNRARAQMKSVTVQFRADGQELVHVQILTHVLFSGRDEEGLARGDQPRIQRPTIPKRRQQTGRVDNGIGVGIWIAQGGPIAMREIDMRYRKPSWHKRRAEGIKLSLYPEGPDPMEIVLDGLGIEQTSSVKDGAGTQ